MWVSLGSPYLELSPSTMELDAGFLPQGKEVFSHYFSNKISAPFSFSSPPGIPMIWMLVFLIWSMGSLDPYTHFLIFFFFLLLCLGEFHCPVVQHTDSLSPSSGLLLSPSIIFCRSVIVFFSSVTSIFIYFLLFSKSLLMFSLHSSILLPSLVSIFMTITLNSLSRK